MRYTPVFAQVYGIRPWEWDRLTAVEALALARKVDEMNEEAARG